MSSVCSSGPRQAQTKTVIDARRQPRHPESVHAAGDNFDCERDSIQLPAELSDDRRLRVGQFETVEARRRALCEQLDAAVRCCEGEGVAKGAKR